MNTFRVKNFIGMLSVAFALLFVANNLMAQDPPEPPCEFTNPCIDQSPWDWSEETYVHTVPGCSNCVITFHYLFYAVECIDDNNQVVDYFAFYLDGIEIGNGCVTSCFPDYNTVFEYAAGVFVTEVLDPLVPAPTGTTIADFKLKSCYKLIDIINGNMFTPCEDMVGCCEFRYSQFGPSPEYTGWQPLNTYSPCDEYAIPYGWNDCFAACGAFNSALQEDAMEKMSIWSANNIRIHPNPVQEELSITFEQAIEGESIIQILDLNRNTVHNSVYQNINGIINLNVSELSQGTFFVNILNSEKTILSRKIIISR